MSQLSFQYRALDPRGAATKGVIRAGSQEEAYRQIVAAGMKPLRITSKRGGRRGRGKRITLKDISQFTHQFAVLMEARIPIVDGLRSIADQEQNERLRTVISDMAVQIEGGNTVTDAMSPHRELFGDVFVETIRAAEQSGTMIEVLNRLSDMLDQRYEITKNVKGAMIYPICVVAALGIAVGFLMMFVVPRFQKMFEAKGLDLPLPTQIVIGASEFVGSYWYAILGGIVAGIFGARRAMSVPKVKQRVDNLLHRVPYIKDVLKGMAIGRFSSVLGIALRSGLSLIDALDMSGRASGRPLLQVEAQKLRDQVNMGGRLSDVVVSCAYFPAFTRRMVAAGEEAGELPRMCDIIAQNADREVVHLTKNVTTVIEPILIAGLAGVVLLIAVAVFLPMWDMAALLG